MTRYTCVVVAVEDLSIEWGPFSSTRGETLALFSVAGIPAVGMDDMLRSILPTPRLTEASSVPCDLSLGRDHVKALKPLRSEVSYFLQMSYNVRYEIYRAFYEVNRFIPLTYGHQASIHNPPTPYRISPSGINLLLSCRQVNEEVSRMIYSTNSFELTPGHINVLKMSPYPHSNSCLFFSNLRVITFRTIKKLRIVLGTKIFTAFIGMIDESFGQLPEVEILIRPLAPHFRGASRKMHRQFLEEVCQKIARVRSGDASVTRWDDSNDPDTIDMLRKVMPTGYKKI